MALAVVGLIALPSTAGAAASDPTMYRTSAAGPIAIYRTTEPQPFGQLVVPAGKWVAWAKLQVGNGNGSDYMATVRCTLSARNGTNGIPPATSAQTGYVSVLYDDGGPTDFDSISLQASLNSPRNSVTFALRCRDESTFPLTNVPSAYRVRVVAMRLSSLTPIQLQNPIAPTGADRTAGVTASQPAELTHGYRTSDFVMPKSQTPQPVATLPLGAGMWSIRASFSVVSLTGNGPGSDPVNRGYCRLTLGSPNTRAFATTADRVFVKVLDPSTVENRDAYYLDTSGRLSSAGSLRLQCWQFEGQGDLAIRGLRISALKLGYLSVGSAATGNSSASYGRGTPHARYRTTHNAFNIPGDTDTVVGKVKLGAGGWLVYAKLQIPGGGSFRCSLIAPGSTEQAFDAYGDQLVLQRSMELPAFTEVAVSCRGPAEVSYVHLTAIRVQGP